MKNIPSLQSVFSPHHARKARKSGRHPVVSFWLDDEVALKYNQPVALEVGVEAKREQRANDAKRGSETSHYRRGEAAN